MNQITAVSQTSTPDTAATQRFAHTVAGIRDLADRMNKAASKKTA